MKNFYYELYFSKIKIFKEIDDLSLLVWDNSAIHKSGKIKDFLNNSGMRIITLAPYNSCLNLTEHLIGAINVKNQVWSLNRK